QRKLKQETDVRCFHESSPLLVATQREAGPLYEFVDQQVSPVGRTTDAECSQQSPKFAIRRRRRDGSGEELAQIVARVIEDPPEQLLLHPGGQGLDLPCRALVLAFPLIDEIES